MTSRDGRHDYDVVVVGSGFGGSVAALRLTEKGYRVLVLEAGRRFADDELPTTSWDIRRFLWAPALGCYGIQRITLLGHALVLSGAGVGGGSLVYANTLYQPGEGFFRDRQWRDITDWRDELGPHYDTAQRMLGAAVFPGTSPADEAMRDVAEQMGRGHTFGPTTVGVYFGAPGEPAADPYYGGVGPTRTGCTLCGACMTGCRVGAKNTMPKTYLGLAESAGAAVRALTTVTGLRALTGGGWAVDVRTTGPVPARGRGTVTAGQVVLAAGTLGTQRLLHAMAVDGRLPNLSSRLGHLTRTNSESIVGATAATTDVDYSQGVAITSSWYPDPATHIETVRYGPGSNLMGLLATVLVDGNKPGEHHRARWRHFASVVGKDPKAFARSLSVRRWSERSIVTLVMQDLDNSLTVRGSRGPFGWTRLRTSQGYGEPNPTWIPAGNEATRKLAERIGGAPLGSWTEVADIPVTAHILGGCAIGATPEHGVIDAWHRVFGHPGLHVVDGSAISANLGVNPSLSITAQAERAFAHWPNAGDPDPRPPVGATYTRLARIAPRSPVVPAHAPAALRWPVAV